MKAEKFIFKTSNGIFEIIDNPKRLNTLIKFLPIEIGLTLNDIIKTKI